MRAALYTLSSDAAKMPDPLNPYMWARTRAVGALCGPFAGPWRRLALQKSEVGGQREVNNEYFDAHTKLVLFDVHRGA